jgi:polyisoprenoid-binding protein YceI
MKRPMALLLFCIASVQAENIRVEFDPSKTKVEYTVNSTLHTVQGTFALKRGAMEYDSATGKASGEIVIDAASGRSGNDSRDGKMHKAVLESARYPEIRFLPDRVEGVPGEAESEVKLHGQFLLRGTAHEMTMTARVRKENGLVKAKAEMSIPYIQWGLKNPSVMFLKVADKVAVRIEADVTMGAK